MQKIDLNEEFIRALRLMEAEGKSVFVTGKAGTGKSTLLRYFCEHTDKNIVVLAPTGIAAINAGGQTIHSFFNFRPEVTPDTASEIRPKDPKLYRNIDTIIIDEISMVRADLLDCIDVFLRKYGKKRKRPFGGIKMVFIGDLYQLPPVVRSKDKKLFNSIYRSPYFFDARVFSEIDLEFIELEKIYRQKDRNFIELLNRIRNNTVTSDDLERLNTRVMPDFQPSGKDFYIYLTTTNALAERINMEKLSKIRGKERVFKGEVKGNFPESDLPTSTVLTLKRGAQVMLLNNDSLGRWINGSIGKIVDFVREDGEDLIFVELEDGEVVDVFPFRWETIEYYYDEDKRKISSSVTGSFTQYPLRLSWAVTIHKSQGKTFDRVIIDLGHGTFAHGQVYVALSRCTSFDGIILKNPLKKGHILMDRRVVEFLTKFQYTISEREMPLDEKISVIIEAIERQEPLEITYLKKSDEKTKRIIHPISVGEMYYGGKKFIGLRAYCTMRDEERNFRIDRILRIRQVVG